MQSLSPYKMQEIVDKEIDDLLEMGVIERSEALTLHHWYL